jgi:fructosamine-3-kinase
VTGFARRVATLMGVGEDQLERLSGGDLSQVLLFRRPDGRCTVAKSGFATATEAAMLRALADFGLPTPTVEGEYDGVLLLDHVDNDGVFSPRAWASIGEVVRRLHDQQGESYGWPVDFGLGSVALDNREMADWPRFWAERRLIATASVLDRPWRERVDVAAERLPDLLPRNPVPSLLHGDLWTGNLLVEAGKVAALIDPACYYGHNEVDLAMLALFDTSDQSFQAAYGALDSGWEERRPAYQLFPALTHMRLLGPAYGGLVERLLEQLGA